MQTLSRTDAINMVAGIAPPTTNEYFELTSADGFALLGLARSMLGLEWSEQLAAMRQRDCKLGGANHILPTKVQLDASCDYLYTLWTCLEFLHAIKSSDPAIDSEIAELMVRVGRVGAFPNGLMRYTDEEIHYMVPNMSSAGAILYARAGSLDKAQNLLNLLAMLQTDGRWYYYNFKTAKVGNHEDTHHHCLMIHQLRELQAVTGWDTSAIVGPAVGALRATLGADGLPPCKFGWGWSMASIALRGVDDEVGELCFQRVLTQSISHANFRVRAFAAWAVATRVSQATG